MTPEIFSEIVTQDVSQAPGLYPLQSWMLPYLPLIHFFWSGLFLVVLLSVFFYYIVTPYFFDKNESKQKPKRK